MAPLVAALIKFGLPVLASAVASKGKDLIQEKLGVDIDAALGTEEGRFNLRQLEIDHEQFLVDSALEHKRLDLADTASAREMNNRVQESAHASMLAKNIMPLLALIVVLGGGALLWITKEPDVRTAVVGLITLVLGFFFGSSRSSQSKDATISALSAAKGEQQ